MEEGVRQLGKKELERAQELGKGARTGVEEAQKA